MVREAAAVAIVLGFVGTALGQITLVSDERYAEYHAQVIIADDVLDETTDREDALFGLPFTSSIGGSVFFGGSSATANADQSSSILGDTISADLYTSAFSDAAALEQAGAIARSSLAVVFTLAAPTPYEFAVTSWSEVNGGVGAAVLSWDEGTGVLHSLTGVGSASGVLAPGDYRVWFEVTARSDAFNSSVDSESAGLSASFSIVPAPAGLAVLGFGGLVCGRRHRVNE